MDFRGKIDIDINDNISMSTANRILLQLWQMPWHLSTSQTPNMLYEYATPIDYRTACGGFGPPHQDSYGITYTIIGDDERKSMLSRTTTIGEFSCMTAIGCFI